MAGESQDYKKILSELIQKQMMVLGPNISLDVARKVQGVAVNDQGNVLDVSGNPELVFKAVVAEYMGLSEQITQIILTSLLEKYPESQSFTYIHS